MNSQERTNPPRAGQGGQPTQTLELIEPNPQQPEQQPAQGQRGAGKKTGQRAQAARTVQPQPRISGRQLMLVVALSRFTVMVVFLPVVTTGEAGRDAWLAAIIAVVGGMAVGALAAVLAARFPGQSIGGLARSAAGIPGLVLATIYGSYFFFIAVAEVSLFSRLLVAVNLPRTPSWAVILPILVIAVYGAALGPDTVGRSSEILITFLLASLFLALVLLPISGQVDLGLLRPVLLRGLRPVLTSTVNPILWFAVSAGSVLAIGKYCEPQRLIKSVVAGTAISGALLIAMALVAITTLGAGEAVDQVSPLLAVARTVFFAGLAERIDVLLLSVLMIGSVFDTTLLILVSTVILSDVFRVRGRIVVIILGALSVVPLAYRGITILDLLDLFNVVPSGIMLATVHIGLVGILLLAAVVRRKKGEARQ